MADKPEARELYDNVMGFCATKLTAPPCGTQPHTIHEHYREMFRRCGQMTLTGLSVPEEYGGLGLDATETAIALEAFGCGAQDMGLVFSVCAHLLAAVMPVVEFGSPGLKRRFLPGSAGGELIGANAITEAEAGSDVFALATTAIPDGDDFMVNGTKSFVTNAVLADYFVTYATVNRAHGFLGVTALVIPKELPGIIVGEPFEKLGLKGAFTSTVYFDDCRVPRSCLLGAIGNGAAIFRRSMQWERLCLFASYVGQMCRQLDLVLEHVKERKQFKKPLSQFQAVRHRVVDMKLRLECCRALLYAATARVDRHEDAQLQIAMSKLAISEAAVAGGLDVVRIFGGTGTTLESKLPQFLMDAVPSLIFSGTSEIQKEIIAKELGL